jgi:TP901 family phage tail tape measure protein
MANIGTLTANLALQSAAFVRDLGKASNAVASNTAQMRKHMKAVETASRGVARQFSQVRGAAAALGVGVALNKLRTLFTQFETSLQRTVGLVGVAQDQVNAFGAEIIKLGPAVGKGPGELADALFFITSAGLQGQTALETLERSARAAAAGLGETKQVADAVTSAMNAYSASGLTAAQATDVLVATVREGKLEASELSGAIGQVLAVAESASVRFDEVGASVAALTRIGIGTSEAVTGLRSVLVALTKETASGQEALRVYGLSYTDLRKSIRENGLIETLIDLRRTVGSNETAMVDIFGRVEAVNTVLAMTGANVDQVRGIFDRMSQSAGTLEKAFEAIAGTAEQRLNSSFATFAQSAIELGNTIIPAFAGGVELAAKYLRELVAVFAGLVAFKAAAYFVGITTAVLNYAKVIATATAAQGFLNAAMMAFPLARVISLVAGAAAAIYVFKDSTISIGDTTIKVGKVVNAVWVTVSETIKGTIVWFYKLSEAVGKFLLLDGKGAFESLRESGDALRTSLENITKAWSEISEPVRNGADEVKKAMDEINQAIQKVEVGTTAYTEEVRKAIETLRRENDQLTALKAAYGQGAQAVEDVNDAREVQNELVRLGIDLQSEEGQQVAGLVVANRELERQIDQAKAAQEEYARIGEQAFDRIGSAVTEMMVNGKSAALDWKNIMLGVISEVYQAFIKLAAINPILNSLFGGDRATIGGGWLSDLFGGGGGTSSAMTSAMTAQSGHLAGYASGTPSAPAGMAWVGEEGPELVDFKGGEQVYPSALSRVVANDNRGPQVNIDARGADREGMRRLEATVAALNGSIERRAISAVTGARGRSQAKMREAFA